MTLSPPLCARGTHPIYGPIVVVPAGPRRFHVERIRNGRYEYMETVSSPHAIRCELRPETGAERTARRSFYLD